MVCRFVGLLLWGVLYFKIMFSGVIWWLSFLRLGLFNCVRLDLFYLKVVFVCCRVVVSLWV